MMTTNNSQPNPHIMTRTEFENAYNSMMSSMITKYNEDKNILDNLRNDMNDLILARPRPPMNHIYDPRNGPRLPRIQFLNKLNEFNRNAREISMRWDNIIRNHQMKVDMLREQITKQQSIVEMTNNNIKSIKKIHDLIVSTSRARETGFDIEYGQFSDYVLDHFDQLGVHIDRPVQTILDYDEESEKCSCYSEAAFICNDHPCETKRSIQERNAEKRKDATITTSGRVIIPQCFV